MVVFVSMPKVSLPIQDLAGGDNTLGPNLAVNAMAAGRTAAEGVLAGFSSGLKLRKGA